ncbi:hypothetical protein CYMTET_38241 [Cymbomonas tetramitiformis]|uniref:GATA-type domain-containing protein n=1 Tax=Cymbomonas tetramitiformis TaxID=36881 RepID=A0AAE0F5F0_9CHLO|nr:hypothetical protein CYMTET_38241 [Cymbomonas tetramitiformis]
MFQTGHTGSHHSSGYGVKALGSSEGNSVEYPGLDRLRSKELEAEFAKYFILDAVENLSQPCEKRGSCTPEDPKGPLDFELSDYSADQQHRLFDSEDCATSTLSAPVAHPHYSPKNESQDASNTRREEESIREGYEVSTESESSYNTEVDMATGAWVPDTICDIAQLDELDILTHKLIEHADSFDISLQCASVCEEMEQMFQGATPRVTRSLAMGSHPSPAATEENSATSASKGANDDEGVLTRSRIVNHKPPTGRKQKRGRPQGSENKQEVPTLKPKPAKVQKTEEAVFRKAQEVPRFACRNCHSSNTPQWRMGPEGPKTLCNACGVRYRKGLPLDGSS